MKSELRDVGARVVWTSKVSGLLGRRAQVSARPGRDSEFSLLETDTWVFYHFWFSHELLTCFSICRCKWFFAV